MTLRMAKVMSSKQMHLREMSAVAKMVLRGANKTSVRSWWTAGEGSAMVILFGMDAGIIQWFSKVFDMAG